MRKLTWWFRLVGGLYLLLGLGFVPAINARRIPRMLPGFDALPGSVAYHAFLDFTFMFGLDLMVIGGSLLYASRNPKRHLSLLWLVVALEIVRGILDDLYMISQGYAPTVLLGFIALHLVIIASGMVLARQPEVQEH